MQTEFSIDWREARQRRERWQKPERPANIFTGTITWQKGKIEGVDVLKLSVAPEGKEIPDWKILVDEPDWEDCDGKKVEKFDWQQSTKGRFDLYFSLEKYDQCLGLGERFSTLNLKGEKHTLVSTDNPNHDETMDSMYVSIPYLILKSGSKYSGMLLDTAAPVVFDLDTEMTGDGHIQIMTLEGFCAYFIGPATLPEIQNAFTRLTGRAKLPPRWSLGHQQSRWSYANEQTAMDVAKEFREKKIPCDTMVLDIDYMEDYKVFSVCPERFPHFDQLIQDLKKDNFQTVVILDPGVKQLEGFDVFEDGKKNGYFCKTTDGDLFVRKVWPGESVFPDFFQDEVRDWWSDRQKVLTDKGVRGMWNDMNEPAFFDQTDFLPEEFTEMNPDSKDLCWHETEAGRLYHLEVRNRYGSMMAKATHDGLMKARPNERPFVLTRAAGSGIQNYSAVWLGDNNSSFGHLKNSIPMLINLGLSGVPFTGADIGGFWKHSLPELLIRWYEVGIFYPLFRNHCALTYRAQEIFSYAPNVETLGKKLIEFRYSILPYVQNLFWEYAKTGAPPVRPLLYHFPDDQIASEIDNQFLFGENIMVAPIVERGKTWRLIYFPEGKWYHIESEKVYEGNKSYPIEIPLGTVPAFVKEGSIIPFVEPMQHTGEYATKGINFKVYGDQASGKLFEDDGISFDYENGAFNEFDIRFSNGKLQLNPIHKGFEASNQLSYQTIGKSGKTRVERPD